jgi:SAM-dependent methyltransferase
MSTKPVEPRAATSGYRTTLAYYEGRSAQYHRATAHLDVSSLYAPFLRELAPGAHILDAGCGSGRDAKAFAERGYRVTAIDASPASARLASAFTGRPCQVLSFQELACRDEYDGLWACASLVHVAKRDMPDVMRRFVRSLKRGGVLYVSLKDGDEERTEDDGRFFNDYTAATFRDVTATVPALRELAVWATDDLCAPERRGAWWNFLLKKLGET